MAMPAQLRRPVATIFSFLPSGSYDSTSALLGIPGRTQRVALDPGLQAALGQRFGKYVERDVRSGTDREQQPFAVGGKHDVARPMMDPRYPSDDRVRLAHRDQVTVLVGKSDDAVAVGDIDPFGIRPERIERDPERLGEPAGEDFVFGGRGAARWDPPDAHDVGRAV